MFLLPSFTIVVLLATLGLALPVKDAAATSRNLGSEQIVAEAGKTDSVSLRFAPRRHGCLVNARESLWFDVTVHETPTACDGGHITVNGQPISWSGTAAEGAGVLPLPRTGRLRQREAAASWKVSCIGDEVLAMSIKIHQLGHRLVQGHQGFTLFFKQQRLPKILKWVGTPIDVTSPNTVEPWAYSAWPKGAESHPQSNCLEASTNTRGLSSVFRKVRHRLQEITHPATLQRSKFTQFPMSSETEVRPLGLRKQGSPAISHKANQYPFQHLGSQLTPLETLPGSVTTDPAVSSRTSDQPLSTRSPLPSKSTEPIPSPADSGSSRAEEQPQFPSRYGNLHLSVGFRCISYLLLSVLLAILIFSLWRLRVCYSTEDAALEKTYHGEHQYSSTEGKTTKSKAFRTCWTRKRDTTSGRKRDEENGLLLEQEKLPGLVVQDELRGCRAVSEVVRDILAEGRPELFNRHHRHHQQIDTTNNASIYTRLDDATPAIPAPTHHSHPNHATRFSTLPTNAPDSLPPMYRRSSRASSTYSSSSSIPPPSYEQHLETEGDLGVADGFMYSSTSASSLSNHGQSYHVREGGAVIIHDNQGSGEEAEATTPDSSVVSCSPRMSFDTTTTRWSM